jgi:hypothetical protein
MSVSAVKVNLRNPKPLSHNRHSIIVQIKPQVKGLRHGTSEEGPEAETS